MKKRSIYVDPALGKDRFDFSGEPLTEEDIKKISKGKVFPEGIPEEFLQKGFDHRWVYKKE